MTFAELFALASSLDAEEHRAAEEGLSQDEYVLFQMIFRDNLTMADRERLKQASRGLLKSLHELLTPMENWTQNSATQAEVKVCILDNLWESLPRPPFTDDEAEAVAGQVYDYFWQRSTAGNWRNDSFQR